MDHFGLVNAVDRLGQGVAIAIADAVDRRLDPGFGKAFAVFDRDVLTAAIRVMDGTTALRRSPIMQRLFCTSSDDREPYGQLVPEPPLDKVSCVVP